jgi:hypothetical protein
MGATAWSKAGVSPVYAFISVLSDRLSVPPNMFDDTNTEENRLPLACTHVHAPPTRRRQGSQRDAAVHRDSAKNLLRIQQNTVTGQKIYFAFESTAHRPPSAATGDRSAPRGQARPLSSGAP